MMRCTVQSTHFRFEICRVVIPTSQRLSNGFFKTNYIQVRESWILIREAIRWHLQAQLIACPWKMEGWKTFLFGMGQRGWCEWFWFQRFHLFMYFHGNSTGTETMWHPPFLAWRLADGGRKTFRFSWFFRTLCACYLSTFSIANTLWCAGPCWHQLSDGRHADALASCRKKPLGESGFFCRRNMTSAFYLLGSPKHVMEYRHAIQYPIISNQLLSFKHLYCLISRDS